MNPKLTSALILVSTLALGAVLGATAAGALAKERRPGPRPPGGEVGGFVEHMERVLRPHDEAQRTALRPFLETTDRRNREVIAAAEEAMRGALTELRHAIDSLTDTDQKARLDRAIATARPLTPEPGGPSRPPGNRPIPPK